MIGWIENSKRNFHDKMTCLEIKIIYLDTVWATEVTQNALWGLHDLNTPPFILNKGKILQWSRRQNSLVEISRRNVY